LAYRDRFGRVTTTGWTPGTVAVNTPILQDLSSFVPPVPVQVVVSGKNNNAAVQVPIFGGIPDGYTITATIDVDGGGAADASGGTNTAGLGLILTEFQGMYTLAGGNLSSVQGYIRGWWW